MSALARLIRLAARTQEIALCLVRKWWRPAICLSIGGSIIVNGMVIPLVTHMSPDLGGLAALVAAAAPFGVMRGLEKMKGVQDA